MFDQNYQLNDLRLWTLDVILTVWFRKKIRLKKDDKVFEIDSGEN